MENFLSAMESLLFRDFLCQVGKFCAIPAFKSKFRAKFLDRRILEGLIYGKDKNGKVSRVISGLKFLPRSSGKGPLGPDSGKYSRKKSRIGLKFINDLGSHCVFHA